MYSIDSEATSSQCAAQTPSRLLLFSRILAMVPAILRTFFRTSIMSESANHVD